VNSGIGRSGKVLRRVIGLPDNTAAVTNEVLAAVAKRDTKAIIVAINDERLRFLKSLKTWPVFGAGWGRRLAEVKAFSLHLAEHPIAEQAPTPRPAEVAPAKGIVPPPAIVKETVTKGVPAGGVAGGITFWDWIAAHPFETAAIGLLGAGAIGGAVYALDRWHRAQQEAPTPNLIPVAA
jgi:lysozyme family protein